MSKPLTPEEWKANTEKQAALRLALQQPVLQEALATLRQTARPRLWNPMNAELGGLKLAEFAGWLNFADALEGLGEEAEKVTPRTDGVQIGAKIIYPEDITEMTPEQQAEFFSQKPNQP
jgi:hypothetical protein